MEDGITGDAVEEDHAALFAATFGVSGGSRRRANAQEPGYDADILAGVVSKHLKV